MTGFSWYTYTTTRTHIIGLGDSNPTRSVSCQTDRTCIDTGRNSINLCGGSACLPAFLPSERSDSNYDKLSPACPPVCRLNVNRRSVDCCRLSRLENFVTELKSRQVHSDVSN
jgi:hypothetical protein